MSIQTPASNTPTVQDIIECIKTVTSHEVTPETDIFDSAGVDSLAVLRIRANLKAQFGFPISASAFFNGRTPAGIAQRIEGFHANS